MSAPRQAVIFLRGQYQRTYLEFYRRLCRGRFTIAADGGCAFFKRAGLSPDLIIGDLDSSRSWQTVARDRTEVISYPPDKDFTDAHLAVEYCREYGYHDVIIVQPDVGEPDHFVANLMLPLLTVRSRRRQSTVRIIHHLGEWRALHNERLRWKRRTGDGLSIIPVSATIRLSITGVAFPVRNLTLPRGDSRPLRNTITATIASLTVRGTALVYRRFRTPGKN